MNRPTQVFVRETSEKKGMKLTSSSSWYGVCIAVDNPGQMGVGSKKNPAISHINPVFGNVSNLSVETRVPVWRISQFRADQTGHPVEVQQFTHWKLR